MTQSPPPQADLIPSDPCGLTNNRVISTFSYYYVSVLIFTLTVVLMNNIEGEEDLVGI